MNIHISIVRVFPFIFLSATEANQNISSNLLHFHNDPNALYYSYFSKSKYIPFYLKPPCCTACYSSYHLAASLRVFITYWSSYFFRSCTCQYLNKYFSRISKKYQKLISSHLKETNELNLIIRPNNNMEGIQFI